MRYKIKNYKFLVYILDSFIIKIKSWKILFNDPYNKYIKEFFRLSKKNK